MVYKMSGKLTGQAQRVAKAQRQLIVSSQQHSSGVYAGASSFNIFFNDMNNGSEYTSSRFVENIKLGGRG